MVRAGSRRPYAHGDGATYIEARFCERWVWGGEVTPVIAVADGRVASRFIRLDAQRGSWNGLRFTYGKNMAGCNRTVLEQEVHAALYGFGAGLPYTDEEGNYVAGYRRNSTSGK